MNFMKPKSKQPKPATNISRTTTGLRQALFDEMDMLRNGQSNAQRARSIALMANSILQSVSVEIEYHKYVRANQGMVDGTQQKSIPLDTELPLDR